MLVDQTPHIFCNYLQPEEKIKNPERKNNTKRKKKGRPRKQEVEPDFEVIQHGGLTMSTIIATTEVLPFQKETPDDEEDWGIVKAPEPGPDPARSATQTVDTRVEPKPESSDDVEFIQIPDREESKVELLSDTSSTCSFDVIDENKRRAILDGEKDSVASLGDDDNGDSDDGDQEGDDDDHDSGDIHVTEFHFDLPTMVALFCLTAVLGFVIGHGKSQHHRTADNPVRIFYHFKRLNEVQKAEPSLKTLI